MTRTPIYRYLGDNGLIESTVYIPGVNSVKLIYLASGDGRLLTKDNNYFCDHIIVPEKDAANWYEVKDSGQE